MYKLGITRCLKREMINSACYGCEKRTVGCHGTCEYYLAWKAEKDAIRDDIRKKRSADYAIGQILYGRSAERRQKYYRECHFRGSALPRKKK